MNKNELEAIRARCAKATPGPWKYIKDHLGFLDIVYYQEKYRIATCAYGSDAELLAHCREDIPALLDALEEADECIAKVPGEFKQALSDRDYWKARAEEEAHKKSLIFKLCASSLIEHDEIAENEHKALEAERDHWKARADALEDAIKQVMKESVFEQPCDICAFNRPEGCCLESCGEYSHWEFDEARLMRDYQ